MIQVLFVYNNAHCHEKIVTTLISSHYHDCYEIIIRKIDDTWTMNDAEETNVNIVTRTIRCDDEGGN